MQADAAADANGVTAHAGKAGKVASHLRLLLLLLLLKNVRLLACSVGSTYIHIIKHTYIILDIPSG